MSTKVLAFKLLGGEEVVAELKSANRNGVLTELGPREGGPIESYTVRRPHILRFQPVAPGQVGLAFIPWTLSNPTIDEVVIPAKAVLVTFDPSENVERQYLESTSGLALPERNVGKVAL